MMIALPAEEWAIFRQPSCAQMAIILVEMTQHIRLAALKKHKRGPKKPKAKPNMTRENLMYLLLTY